MSDAREPAEMPGGAIFCALATQGRRDGRHLRRDLSGIFFRYRDPMTGRFENRTFEDLPPSEQDRVMSDRSSEWLRSLAKQLAKTLREVGDICDVSKHEPDDES